MTAHMCIGVDPVDGISILSTGSDLRLDPPPYIPSRCAKDLTGPSSRTKCNAPPPIWRRTDKAVTFARRYKGQRLVIHQCRRFYMSLLRCCHISPTTPPSTFVRGSWSRVVTGKQCNKAQPLPNDARHCDFAASPSRHQLQMCVAECLCYHPPSISPSYEQRRTPASSR